MKRHQRQEQLVNPNSIMNAFNKDCGESRILITESSTHTIVVKESETSDFEDDEDLDEENATNIAEA